MRRTLIHTLLPAAFCLLPLLAAGLIFAAVPPDARRDYLTRVAESPIDWVILALGLTLFAAQTALSWPALRWDDAAGDNFDTRPDKWLTHLTQAAEWFPLLGLIGTVAAILQTFGSITPGSTPQEIIRKYAPAITATGSGLFMAFMNILPGWVVNGGRMLIQSLAGSPARTTAPPVVSLTPAPPQSLPDRSAGRGG